MGGRKSLSKASGEFHAAEVMTKRWVYLLVNAVVYWGLTLWGWGRSPKTMFTPYWWAGALLVYAVLVGLQNWGWQKSMDEITRSEESFPE